MITSQFTPKDREVNDFRGGIFAKRQEEKGFPFGYVWKASSAGRRYSAAIAAEETHDCSISVERSQRFRPRDFARYRAASALRSNWEIVVAIAGLNATTPKLAVTAISPSVVRTGADAMHLRIRSACRMAASSS